MISEYTYNIDESIDEAEIEEINGRIHDNVRSTTKISDGFHTFGELYRYRLLYNAAFFNLAHKYGMKVFKSKRHSDGEPCFGGNYFIVQALLPTGQISNHYLLDNWDYFKIPELKKAYPWDGHTPEQAADRLEKYVKRM